jgi:hypothetical protein
MIEFQAKDISAPLFNAVCTTVVKKAKQITHFYSFADALATMNCFRFCRLYITA